MKKNAIRKGTKLGSVKPLKTGGPNPGPKIGG